MIRGKDYYFTNKPYKKNVLCADLGYLKKNKDSLFFALADVAGHGDGAYQLAPVIKKYFKDNHRLPLVELMSGLHEHLKGTRGAVGVAGTLVLKTGLVEYIGIGNISMRVFGKTHSRIPSNEGIIGYAIQALKIQTVQLSPGEVLLLYTDGIRDHFNASECPRGFFKKDAGWIVENVMKYFYKGDDDAGCIAIRA